MKYLLLAFQYLPFVLQGIIAVESAMPGAPGASKKQTVLSAVAAAAGVGETVPEPHVKVISGLIDNLVSMLNASGVFTKSTPAPAPASTPVAAPPQK